MQRTWLEQYVGKKHTHGDITRIYPKIDFVVLSFEKATQSRARVVEVLALLATTRRQILFRRIKTQSGKKIRMGVEEFIFTVNPPKS